MDFSKYFKRLGGDMSYYELLSNGLSQVPDGWQSKFQVIEINKAVSCLQFTKKGFRSVHNAHLDTVRFQILNNLLSIYKESLEKIPHAIRLEMNNYKGIYIYAGCHNPELFLKQDRWKSHTQLELKFKTNKNAMQFQ